VPRLHIQWDCTQSGAGRTKEIACTFHACARPRHAECREYIEYVLRRKGFIPIETCSLLVVGIRIAQAAHRHAQLRRRPHLAFHAIIDESDDFRDGIAPIDPLTIATRVCLDHGQYECTIVPRVPVTRQER
jgi:hypothetical protein